MQRSTWSKTQLYLTLSERKSPYADSIRNLLDRPNVMEAIEAILDFGSTTPKDFTLHNAEHSFRVAERMWQLIPGTTKSVLSDYELGMLLLSAYLHDIGMSPEYDKVQRLQLFLKEIKEGILSDEEIDEFQKWIDNDTNIRDIDIRKEFITETKTVNYILSYYIRYKHNDWSGDWIKRNLIGENLKNYPHWTDDLILICKSHHHGLDHLLGEAFDPRPIAMGAVVHLRYLSICLRVADVMENDPERTPEVILAHRQISSDSLKYWLKDHQFTLLEKDNIFIIHARPGKAFIHKAIEETADLIENELKLCDELIRRKPINYSPSLDLKGYKWEIDPLVKRDISPYDSSYEYINGAFKPNTAKILELLGGHQLYGDSIWAYRELIQNAFDAVKERIAYHIVNEKLSPREHLAMLGELYTIDLSLEKREDGIWLTCKDRGVGMTKSIIERYFLQSGVSQRHEIRELERECKKMGFNLARTGQFGIGVLSYFMLSDKVIIRTQRDLNTGYHAGDSVAWRFEISGTHDFGELTRLGASIRGTEIALKLKEEIANDIEEWDHRFHEFMKDNIIRAPCMISYRSFLKKEVKVGPGWTNDESDIRFMMTSHVRSEISKRNYSRGNMLTSSRRQQLEKEDRHIEEMIDDMAQKMDFLIVEGEVDNVARFRAHIPYFKLLKGNSFSFFRERIEGKKHYILKVSNGYRWTPSFGAEAFGLKGINVEVTTDKDHSLSSNFPFANIELDLEQIDEKKLDVSREELVVDDGYLQGLRSSIEVEIAALLSKHAYLFKNEYALLNWDTAEFFPEVFHWAVWDRSEITGQDLIWDEFKFPLLSTSDSKLSEENMMIGNEQLFFVCNMLKIFTDLSVSSRERSWEHNFRLNYKLGLYEGKPFAPYLVITKAPDSKVNGIIQEVELPGAWSNLLLVRDREDIVGLNKDHTLARYYAADVYYRFSLERLGLIWPDPASKIECLTFLVFIATRLTPPEGDSWLAMCEKKPELMKAVFDRLETNEILLLDRFGLHIVSFGANGTLKTEEEIEAFLPRCDDENFLIRKQV